MSTLQSKSSINSHWISRAMKRLHNEYKKFMESPPENITVAFEEDLILEWHFLFTGLNGTPFERGEYHGTLMFPEDYPFSPPSIQFITPNGRFKTEERICFALIHSECWKPAYTVSAVLQGVYSFMMTETTDTVGSLNVDESEIKELAGKSREFNLKYGSTQLFQNEIKVARTNDSNFDTDIPLFRKSQFHSSDMVKPTVSIKEANTTETIDTITVMNEKVRKEIIGKKRNCDLKDGSKNLVLNEVKVIIPKLSDADTNPPLKKKRKNTDYPSSQKTDHKSSPETLEQDVPFCKSDEVSLGTCEKENLAAKSSSGKGNLAKYINTANYKPRAKNQSSTKSLHQQSSPIRKDCLHPNESSSKHEIIRK